MSGNTKINFVWGEGVQAKICVGENIDFSAYLECFRGVNACPKGVKIPPGYMQTAP